MESSQISDLEKFEALFQGMPGALAFLRGPELVFEMTNDAYLEIVGRKNIVGKPLREAIPEVEGQIFPEILRRVLETGEAYQLRETLTYIEPEEGPPRSVYIDVNYRRINDGGGRPYGVLAFILDVTEKVLARRGVAEERDKLEAVFASATASLGILRGPEAVYEKVNDSYATLFNGRELVGHTILAALPELAGQKFPTLLSEVFRTGETYRETEAVAYLRRTGDGPLEERYFDQSYSRIETHGKPYGVLIQALDVTDRVRARRDLAETNDRFRLALEAANMGSWEVNLQKNRVTWSKRARELFGMPEHGEVDLNEAIRRIVPEDQARVSEAIARATDPNGDGTYDIKYRVAVGRELRWLALRGKSFFKETPQGREISSFQGTMLDETASVLAEETLRASERKFRRMADLMPQIAWTATPEGILDYTNDRWTAYSGSNTPADWLSFVHDDDRESATAAWIKSVHTGEPYGTEFRLRRASDQVYRWFLVRASASFDKTGAVEKWFGTCTDIEEQKAELSARSEFMSIASHELKTPLTSLKLQTQSLRRNFEKGRADAFTNERLQGFVLNQEKQISRLVRLVDDMLDFARIDAGKLSMQREPADLGELVREVFDHLREQLESKGAPATFSAEGSLNGYVDKFRLEQVITNLLTNALRYGLGKPIRVRVEEQSGSALITVADGGRGVPAELHDKIFHRFERGISANEVSGLGLGLFISREIVNAHGGRIWVESEPGKGATFFVSLPLQSSSPAPKNS